MEDFSASEILHWACTEFGNDFAVATSFQKESMVIIDLASRIRCNVNVFTLDTGRLPAETLSMIDAVRSRYGIAVEVVQPDPLEVQGMVQRHGPDLFYESVGGRELCCEIRKVRPLSRKLAGLRAWATGLRREQSPTRAAVPKVETVDGRVKISPLVDWTTSDVDRYIREHNVPLHPLYARGYASIGCAPCSRPIQIGEDERAGRWWWERDGHRECGIHFAADGSVRRA